jgi:hypothetical protein
MLHAWERWELHTKFHSGNLKGRDHFGDLGADERIILKWILKEQVLWLWNGNAQNEPNNWLDSVRHCHANVLNEFMAA